MRHSKKITEAFQAFCQAALFSPGSTTRNGQPSEVTAATRAVAACRSFGFSEDDLHRLGCGLYRGPAAILEDLRSLGFAEEEIEAVQLASDSSGRPRAELAGCLVVPLTDETGIVCDFLCVTLDEKGLFSRYRFLYGSSQSQIVAYGLHATMSHLQPGESLTLVDDVLECFLLQSRGLHNVAAIGEPGGDFTPRRWEELARLGFKTATLAFRQDDRHAISVRDVLVSALRARTAPEVFVANPYPGSERSAADVLRRFGKEACISALAARSLAFHDKDFGAADRERRAFEESRGYVASVVGTSEPDDEIKLAPREPHFREAFRQRLRELIAGLSAEERTECEHLISAVDAAVSSGDRRLAVWRLERFIYDTAAGMGGWHQRSWSFEAQVHNHANRPTLANAAEVLDRVRKPFCRAEIPNHLQNFTGHDSRSSVEWIVDASPHTRIASICERIIDACERRPSESFYVVCCEHTERQMMLALVAHLASRLSNGSGLSASDVEARFTGNEPANGYTDKPWLIDEAADRIRIWSGRLTFLNMAGAYNPIEQAIEIARSNLSAGGIFFDAIPHDVSRQYVEHGGADWIPTLASRFAGTITIATSMIPACRPLYWPYGSAGLETQAAWLRHSATARQIFDVLRDWLRREEEETGRN